MEEEAVLVLSTAPDMDSAEKMAKLLVKERLVACINLLPNIRSYYWWKEEIRSDEEVLMIMKTFKAKFSQLESRIREVHPYDTPEIIACPISMISKDYLEWMISELGRK